MAIPLAVPAVAPAEWSLAQRIAFRFAFLYVLFYGFPFPLYLDPVTRFLGPWTLDPIVTRLQWVLPWFGRVALGVDVSRLGWDDQALVALALRTAIVIASTAAWSLAARGTSEHRMHLGALLIYARYFLAYTMFSYGWEKVIPIQFGQMSGDRLVQPLGELTPMGLLWAFMAYSRGYTMFTGFAEVLGGVLLFFRQTATLGALIVATVMANVVLMNFSYDVPVKVHSAHYLALALVVAAPDARRIADVFIRGRGVDATPLAPRTTATRIAKTLLIAVIAWSTIPGAWTHWKKVSVQPPLAGVYTAEGEPAISRVGIGFGLGTWGSGIRIVYTGATPSRHYRAKLDDPARIVLLPGNGVEIPFAVKDLGGGRFEVSGTLDGKPLTVVLTRLETQLQ